MLHHVSLPVSDLESSAALYDAMMEALGYRRVVTADTAVGYGVEDGKDKLLLSILMSCPAKGLSQTRIMKILFRALSVKN